VKENLTTVLAYTGYRYLLDESSRYLYQTNHAISTSKP